MKFPLALVAALLLPRAAALAQDVRAEPAPPVTYTAEELDNLVAPIALYPDPILAQVLIAATFSDQLQVAADFVREHGTANVDDQPWDVSVRAVAHYPPVLNMMVERPDWTLALGQAYAAQSTDVMESVQNLRQMAQAQGNLASTPQQTVEVTGSKIVIVPAQPRIIYVPTYDPAVIYFRHVGYLGGWPAYWSFGIGFPIGAWLSYDCDWYNYAVYYDGWMGGGWRIASRPFISLTIAYVSPRYAHVRINRNVLYRPVNYYGLRGYNTIHRTANFAGRDRDRRGDGRVARGGPGGYGEGRRGGEATPDGRDRSRDGGRVRGGNGYDSGPNGRGGTRGGQTADGGQRLGAGRSPVTQGSRTSPLRVGPGMVRPQSKPATPQTIQPKVVRPEPRSTTTPIPQSRSNVRTIRPTIVRPPKQSGGEVIRATPTPSSRSSVRTVRPTLVRPPKQSGGEVIRATPAPSKRSSVRTPIPSIVRPQAGASARQVQRPTAPTIRPSTRGTPTVRSVPRRPSVSAPTVRAPSRAPAARSRPSSARSVRPAVSGASRGKGRSGKGGP